MGLAVVLSGFACYKQVLLRSWLPGFFLRDL